MDKKTAKPDYTSDQEETVNLEDDDQHSKCDSSKKTKTPFSVEDILNPTKFTGQMATFNPEYFLRWQPWLMQEALRQNGMFPDLTLSFYKPFLAKDGKLTSDISVNPNNLCL